MKERFFLAQTKKKKKKKQTNKQKKTNETHTHIHTVFNFRIGFFNIKFTQPE